MKLSDIFCKTEPDKKVLETRYAGFHPAQSAQSGKSKNYNNVRNTTTIPLGINLTSSIPIVLENGYPKKIT